MFGTMPRNSPLGPSASTERGVMHRKRRLLLLLRCMHTPARARAHRHTRTQTHRHTDTRTSLLHACVCARVRLEFIPQLPFEVLLKHLRGPDYTCH
jgi:hypothetical protein